MAMHNKAFIAAVVCVFLALSIVVTVAFAQTFISRPAGPQFTLKLIGGYVVQLTIQNQPLVLTMDNESLYYNVRVKGHLEEKWTELYTLNDPDLVILKGTIPIQSDSQSTVLDYPVKTGQIDFQVEAMYGVYLTQEPASHDPFLHSITAFNILADGESGWSPSQTITVPESTPSPTPTLSPSPSPSSTSSQSPTPSFSPSPSNTPSSTQTPTIELSPTPNNSQENLAPVAVIAGLAMGIIIVALLAYGAKHKGWKQ